MLQETFIVAFILFYTQGEVTSHICGRSMIAILWSNTVILCVVKWWKFVGLFK